MIYKDVAWTHGLELQGENRFVKTLFFGAQKPKG